MRYSKNIFLIVFLVFLDQLSKYFIRHLDGFYICNRGISFGITLSPVIFWIFWITIITALIYYISKNKLDLGLALILSGAMSNIFDRLYLGCVIDFIKLPFWPFFNLADTFITFGVIMLIIKHSRKN